MTHAQFRKLRIDWSVYKEITQQPTDKVGVHLYDICEKTVQNSIVNQHSKFLQLDEKKMLDAIESIVTKRITPAVHRSHFHDTVQGEKESICNYLVRLRSQSIDCEFECESCKFDTSDDHIKDQFIVGLQSDIDLAGEQSWGVHQTKTTLKHL